MVMQLWISERFCNRLVRAFSYGDGGETYRDGFLDLELWYLEDVFKHG